MKKIIIFLIAFTTVAFMNVASNSMYIYNSNGQLLSFNDTDIDSIMFSNIDLNGVECEEIVTQLIYAGDSIYQIPIEKMDSVVFTPRMQQEDEYGITIGHEVDLGLSVNWAGWNVGASSPEQYGGYYAWGEIEEKRGYSYKYFADTNGDGYIDDYTYIGSNITGTQYDVARQKWGGSWRMPTEGEIKELLQECNWIMFKYKGVNGCKVTGPNGKSIFLPAAGIFGTSLGSDSSIGYYWGATLSEAGNAWACYLYFNEDYYDIYSNIARSDGLLVRPVK